MAITEHAPTDLAATIDRSIRRIRIVAWALALGWLCLLVTLIGTSERESSYAELENGLRSSEISTIEVLDTPGFSQGGEGYGRVLVRWRDDLIMRTATLTVASNERMRREASEQVNALPIIVGSVDEHLRALNPDVRVRHVSHEFRSTTILGWDTSGWVGLTYLVLLAGTLGLIAGPRPWRATRWAWAWLVLLAPAVGVPVYFLFGGSTGLFRPRPPARIWLTGGWAFILAFLLGGAASS